MPPACVGSCIIRDCSESTGLSPEDGYCKVRVRTFAPGGQPNVRSRGVSTRPKRWDHRTRRPAPARDRPLQSQRPPATVSALWAPGLSRQAVPADIARLGESRPVVSAGSRGHLFAALLYEVSQVLSRGPL